MRRRCCQPNPGRAWSAGLAVVFARATILLDAKALWWDESLSLQRAEQALPDLLRGVLLDP